MEFFDEALNKAKDVFDVCRQKTGEAVAVGRQKYDIATIKSRLNKNYSALGRICYENFKNDDAAPDEIKALIAAVEQDLSCLRETEAEIVKIKGGNVCYNCGGAINSGSAYCNHCGAKLTFEG